MPDKVTAPKLKAMKQRSEKIVCVTAYDAYFGRLMDEAGVDLVLVGDSLGNVLLGYETTVPVSLAAMIHHTAAVRPGVHRAMLVADMPFGSYQSSVAQCVDSAVALMKAGAEGVKLEGEYCDEIAALVKAGIPVLGHLGMTPQSVNVFGGPKVQGKGVAGKALIEAAKRLEEAGAFGIVLELIPGDLASDITAEIGIPTIGIGAGRCCDGQIQVMHDILGMSNTHFKHARRFVEGEELLLRGIRDYAAAVRSKDFPGDENTF
ncbi:MAG TPA: 3-methyl-2-oxobutanoate hydroxymethyltransferase [Fimbriimonadaceae bacterium]|nr:3-methyl-2-oxobutanoate hydroxymethyltransferase [Fimbriimonadaceae bacterium]